MSGRARKDLRILELNVRHEKATREYAAVREERINLVKTLYVEGWTVEQIIKAMNTTRLYVMRAIPEAFEEKKEPLTNRSLFGLE